MLYRRIRDLREDHDQKQSAVAQYLHVTQATYSRYENGLVDVPTEILIRLAQLYGTSIDYLLDRTDDPTPFSGR